MAKGQGLVTGYCLVDTSVVYFLFPFPTQLLQRHLRPGNAFLSSCVLMENVLSEQYPADPCIAKWTLLSCAEVVSTALPVQCQSFSYLSPCLHLLYGPPVLAEGGNLSSCICINDLCLCLKIIGLVWSGTQAQPKRIIHPKAKGGNLNTTILFFFQVDFIFLFPFLLLLLSLLYETLRLAQDGPIIIRKTGSNGGIWRAGREWFQSSESFQKKTHLIPDGILQLSRKAVEARQDAVASMNQH